MRYIQEILPCEGGEADQQPLNNWVVEAAKPELTLCLGGYKDRERKSLYLGNFTLPRLQITTTTIYRKTSRNHRLWKGQALSERSGCQAVMAMTWLSHLQSPDRRSSPVMKLCWRKSLFSMNHTQEIPFMRVITTCWQTWFLSFQAS